MIIPFIPKIDGIEDGLLKCIENLGYFVIEIEGVNELTLTETINTVETILFRLDLSYDKSL